MDFGAFEGLFDETENDADAAEKDGTVGRSYVPRQRPSHTHTMCSADVRYFQKPVFYCPYVHTYVGVFVPGPIDK